MLLLFRKQGEAAYALADDPGLIEGWWDIENTTTIDTGVSVWAGVLGFANLVQATGGAQPARNATGWNGALYSLDFDGSDDFMTADAIAGELDGADVPFTWAWAGQLLTAGANGDTQMGITSGTDNDPRHVVNRPLGAAWQVVRVQDDGASPATQSGGTLDANRHHFVLSFNGTAITLYVDGAKAINGAAMDVGALTVTRFTVGCLRRITNASFTDMRVGELWILDYACDDAREAEIRADLASRYPT